MESFYTSATVPTLHCTPYWFGCLQLVPPEVPQPRRQIWRSRSPGAHWPSARGRWHAAGVWSETARQQSSA